ncbi:choice-of-anchor M domain-containing protein [Saccharothrix longispora]|uniref:choice-of-anchor M domain-containing protein n=1 Tax=Saccharothrix longispora TaxID=33920 RepID=UPI0028FD4E08|nr:choice-of-anchor M domain-containing protein [Saccharothrix longispora]MBY8848952.1 choice-of-anchor M domain-containing protein [Saccharothrix sp. MB29]MDU0292607.1 choice-of-anchor M domain-containing protein [Saccharothrix longispora]
MPRLIRALLAATAALLLAQPAAHAEAPVVIADGHVDLGPRLLDGRWTLQLRDDTGDGPVWREPDDVVLQVADAARTTVPDDPAYAFLGSPGGDVWVLPQVQDREVVWPGWNTQDPSIAEVVGRGVDWRLHGVEGPGRFELFLTGDFGAPETIFSSERPFPQETGVEAGTHVHGNWVFTAPGAYSLDVEMATADGRADRVTLKVHVGPGDPVTAFATTAPSTPPPGTTSAEPGGSTAPGPPWGWIAAGGVLVAGAAAALVARSRRATRGTDD